MSARRAPPAVLVAALVLLACHCSTSQQLAFTEPDAATPLFQDPDAATDADAEAALPAFCISRECPKGTADCAGSGFRCSTDLLTDNANCGTCGHLCGQPDDPAFNVVRNCEDGQCKLKCTQGRGNCDGFTENGCEADLFCDALNCGGCGTKCAAGEECLFGSCGCPAGTTDCGHYCAESSQVCANLKTNAGNCGACGNQCDFPPGYTPGPHEAPGCANGLCNVTCQDGFAHCSAKLDPADKCETPLTTTTNCGACGKACKPGQFCNDERKCACEAPLVLCDGQCTDVRGDNYNCGACGVACGNFLGGDAHDSDSCVLGVCKQGCDKGYADCNANRADGCEAWLQFDPNNCGACGMRCAEGQPCARGECVTVPCTTPGQK